MHRDEEKRLIRNCQQGDRLAMEVLIKHYEKPVYNAAYRMLGNRDDASDVAQTTFMKAFSKIGLFDPTQRFFSWIYRIAINESINLYSKRMSVAHNDETLASSLPGPEHETDSTQTNAAVQRVLLELTDEYRSVIVLRYFTGCNYEEIAQALRIPEKTVKSRLYTARQRMRTLLGQRGIAQS